MFLQCYDSVCHSESRSIHEKEIYKIPSIDFCSLYIVALLLPRISIIPL